MMAYFKGSKSGHTILAPATKGSFVIKQSKVESLSKGKNLSGKTFKGTISGMPNGMTGAELLEFWIDKASSAKNGVDTANGMHYPQLISKFIMGAVFYNQAVDKYLDEKLGAIRNRITRRTRRVPHTGKEHSWDEAFGYFGVPAHGLT